MKNSKQKEERPSISETKQEQNLKWYIRSKIELQNKLLPTVEYHIVFSVHTKEEQMLQFPADGERLFFSV